MAWNLKSFMALGGGSDSVDPGCLSPHVYKRPHPPPRGIGGSTRRAAADGRRRATGANRRWASTFDEECPAQVVGATTGMFVCAPNGTVFQEAGVDPDIRDTTQLDPSEVLASDLFFDKKSGMIAHGCMPLVHLSGWLNAWWPNYICINIFI